MRHRTTWPGRHDMPEEAPREAPVPPSTAILELQRSAGNRSTLAMLQRKPLTSGKLNVAGETHNESSARRDREKAYAAEKSKGEYWKEGEFRPAQSFFGWLFSSTPHKLGDPLMLRAEHLVSQLKEKWIVAFLEPLSKGTVPPALSSAEPIEVVWPTLRDRLKGALREVQLAVALASQDKAETDEAQVAEPFHKLLDTVIKTKLGGDHTTAADVLEAVRAAVNEFEAKVSKKAVTEDDVMLRRSQAMHQAAEKAASTGGVWKVGDQHIAQMLSAAPKRNYEVLTKDEFNTGFDDWSKAPKK